MTTTKTIKTMILENKKAYIQPDIIMTIMTQDRNNFLMTSVRENLDDEDEHDFHNGAKGTDIPFSSDHWSAETWSLDDFKAEEE